jgi:hypothetical protein
VEETVMSGRGIFTVATFVMLALVGSATNHVARADWFEFVGNPDSCPLMLEFLGPLGSCI